MVRCPVCHKDTAAPNTGERAACHPFCCERCKLIDLGAWLDSEYIIKSNVALDNPDVDDEGYA